MTGSTLRLHSVLLAAIAASSMLVGCNNAQKDELAMLREENSQLQLQRDEARSALDASEAERRRLEEQMGSSQKSASEEPPAAATTATGFDNLPPGVTAENRNGEVVLTIEGDVLFDSGKATLKTDAKRTIDKVVAEIKKQHPNARLRLAGFTDTDPIKKSTFKTNYHLGFERAFNVGEYIASKGFDQSKIFYSSYGPDVPKSTKKASRRVEVAIVND